jgi:phasin family protein
MDAHMSFVNDISKSFFHSFQQVCDLNIQLAQTMLEETTLASQQAMSQSRPTEALSAASVHAQPAAEKLRAYQQHVSRVAADAQVDLARVTEQHVQETSRTAKALADEVQRAASEETERGLRTQQETMRKFSDPFQNTAARGNGGSASMQGANGGSHMGGSSDSPTANSGQQSAAGQSGQSGQPGQSSKPGSPGARKDS